MLARWALLLALFVAAAAQLDTSLAAVPTRASPTPTPDDAWPVGSGETYLRVFDMSLINGMTTNLGLTVVEGTQYGNDTYYDEAAYYSSVQSGNSGSSGNSSDRMRVMFQLPAHSIFLSGTLDNIAEDEIFAMYYTDNTFYSPLRYRSAWRAREHVVEMHGLIPNQPVILTLAPAFADKALINLVRLSYTANVTAQAPNGMPLVKLNTSLVDGHSRREDASLAYAGEWEVCSCDTPVTASQPSLCGAGITDPANPHSESRFLCSRSPAEISVAIPQNSTTVSVSGITGRKLAPQAAQIIQHHPRGDIPTNITISGTDGFFAGILLHQPLDPAAKYTLKISSTQRMALASIDYGSYFQSPEDARAASGMSATPRASTSPPVRTTAAGPGAPAPASHGTNIGAIAGGVVGGVFALAILLLLLLLLIYRRRRRAAKRAAVPEDEDGGAALVHAYTPSQTTATGAFKTARSPTDTAWTEPSGGSGGTLLSPHVPKATFSTSYPLSPGTPGGSAAPGSASRSATPPSSAVERPPITIEEDAGLLVNVSVLPPNYNPRWAEERERAEEQILVDDDAEDYRAEKAGR